MDFAVSNLKAVVESRNIQAASSHSYGNTNIVPSKPPQRKTFSPILGTRYLKIDD